MTAFTENSSVDLLSKILNLLPGHIYWYTLDGIILGMNNQQAQSLGFRTASELIGTNIRNLVPLEYLNDLNQINHQVIKSTVPLELEEQFVYPDGHIGTVLTRKSAWYDDAGHPVGIIGVSLDISRQKNLEVTLESQKNNTEKLLNQILDIIPCHVYWKDLDSRFLGCNLPQALAAGKLTPEDLIGKSDFEMPWKNEAFKLQEIDRQVLLKGTSITVEEQSQLADGEVRQFLSRKKPLKNSKNEIIGLVGVSMDITAEKEVEKLRRDIQERETALLRQEVEKLKFEIKEREAEQMRQEIAAQAKTIALQNRIAGIYAQAAHDIASPLMSLQRGIQYCNELPEKAKKIFQNALGSIQSISKELLDQYMMSQKHGRILTENHFDILPGLILREMTADVANEYPEIHCVFKADHRDLFEGMSAQRSAFKRMIMNLINNAIEAMEDNGDRPKSLLIGMQIRNEHLDIHIQDTGKGMSLDAMNKILDAEAFTHGKSDGHGLGLSQVHETLRRHQGVLSIESVHDVGTTITITFPRMGQPAWIASEMEFDPQDLVVIVDDDPEIHVALEQRLKRYFKSYPDIRMKHFTHGMEALEFMKSLPREAQAQLRLITDYELLKQTYTGFDLIAHAHVKRAWVLTSHYAIPEVQLEALRMGVKIAPKPLMSEMGVSVRSIQESSEMESAIRSKQMGSGMDVSVKSTQKNSEMKSSGVTAGKVNASIHEVRPHTEGSLLERSAMTSSLNINLFHHPSRIVVLDDEPAFLESLETTLQCDAYYLLTTDPERAFQAVMGYQPNIRQKVLEPLDGDYSDGINDSGYALKMHRLMEHVFDQNRAQAVSVLLVDYHMPGQTGIEFCKRLDQAPVARILMTSDEGEPEILRAFEDRVIDGFISKRSLSLKYELEAAIERAQHRYFERLSSTVQALLPTSTFARLYHPKFKALMGKLQKEVQAVEYYMVDESGSFVLLDAHGSPTWLIVRTEADCQWMDVLIEGYGKEAQEMFPTGDRNTLKFIRTEWDFPDAELFSHLKRYSYPAESFDVDCYYAIAREKTPNQFDWGSMVPMVACR